MKCDTLICPRTLESRIVFAAELLALVVGGILICYGSLLVVCYMAVRALTVAVLCVLTFDTSSNSWKVWLLVPSLSQKAPKRRSKTRSPSLGATLGMALLLFWIGDIDLSRGFGPPSGAHV